MGFCIFLQKTEFEEKGIVPKEGCLLCSDNTTDEQIRSIATDFVSAYGENGEKESMELFKENHEISLHEEKDLPRKIRSKIGEWQDEKMNNLEKEQELKLVESFLRLPHRPEINYQCALYTREGNDITVYGVGVLGDNQAMQKAEQLFPKVKQEVTYGDLCAHYTAEKKKLSSADIQTREKVYCTAKNVFEEIDTSKISLDYFKKHHGFFNFFFIDPTMPIAFSHAPTISKLMIRGNYGGFPFIHQFLNRDQMQRISQFSELSRWVDYGMSPKM